MSATARAATTRPAPRRTPRPTTRRPASPSAPRTRPVLREVAPPAPAVAGRGLFAGVVVGLLVAGMGSLLLLNTSLAAGAFEIGSLTRAQHQLAVQEQQLQQVVAVAESPESLQQRAAALGMVPASSPVFLRLADGRVLGDPSAAPRSRTPKPAAGAASGVSPGGRPAATTATGGAGSTTGGATTTATASGDGAVADQPVDAAVADPAPGTAGTTTTSGTTTTTAGGHR